MDYNFTIFHKISIYGVISACENAGVDGKVKCEDVEGSTAQVIINFQHCILLQNNEFLI